MAVTANEDRLNTNADLTIMREIMAYFVATRLTSEDDITTLISRIEGHIHRDIDRAAQYSAQNADSQRTRYKARLTLFSDSINDYRNYRNKENESTS
jgi:hypothetical protein